MLIAKLARDADVRRTLRVGARGGQHAVAPAHEVVAGVRRPPSPRVPSAPWFTVCGVVPVIEPLAPAV